MISLFEKKEFTIDDLNSLIRNKTEEGVYLEFKSSESISKEDERKIELSRDVSAFANADGGILIYGLSEKKGKASKISFISNEPYTKEWLQQVIDSRIERLITNLQIHPITNPENDKEQIFILKIPASTNAPHMAADGCYYRRDSKGKRRMEEYEVREAYSKTGKTELQLLEIKGLRGIASRTENKIPGQIEFHMKFVIKNVGRTVEKHYKLEIKVLNPVATLPSMTVFKNMTNRVEENYRYYTFFNESPLFQDEIIEFGQVNMIVSSGTYEKFLEAEFELKLYYTNGVKVYNYKCAETFLFNGQQITRNTIRH